MRTTAEIIQDLKAAALALQRDGTETMVGVNLAVGFNHHEEYINSSDPEALTKLNDYMQRGGKPIGLLSIIKRGQGPTGVTGKLLPEYEGQDWARQYLNKLTQDASRDLNDPATVEQVSFTMPSTQSAQPSPPKAPAKVTSSQDMIGAMRNAAQGKRWKMLAMVVVQDAVPGAGAWNDSGTTTTSTAAPKWTYTLLHHNDPQLLQNLERALSKGGEAIGFCGINKDRECTIGVFPEYEGQEWPAQLMQQVLENVPA